MDTRNRMTVTGREGKGDKGGKKGILPFTTAWMDLGSIMLSEISQVVKDKYHIVSLISGPNQQNKEASKM